MYKTRYVDDVKHIGLTLETAPNFTAIFNNMATDTFSDIDKSHITFFLLILNSNRIMELFYKIFMH